MFVSLCYVQCCCLHSMLCYIAKEGMSHTRKGIHLGMYSIKMGEKGAKGQLEKNIHQLYVNVTIYFSSVSIHLKCYFFLFFRRIGIPRLFFLPHTCCILFCYLSFCCLLVYFVSCKKYFCYLFDSQETFVTQLNLKNIVDDDNN